MRYAPLLLFLLVSHAAAFVAPDVKSVQTAQSQRDSDRENAQKLRLEQLRRELQTLRQTLRTDDSQFRRLTLQHDELLQQVHQRSARLVEQRAEVQGLYITARQAAGDLATLLSQLETAPPDGQIDQHLRELAGNPRPLNIDALSHLWESMHQILTQTATQSRETLPVQVAPGELQSLAVTRLGSTFAVAADRPVVFDTIAQTYRALDPGDASARHQLAILSTQADGIVIVPFDPGMSLKRKSITLYDTVLSSGPVGYVIVLLGLSGLVLFALRTVLVLRLRRAQRVGSHDSPGKRLAVQRDLHQSERSESLAGWLNAAVRREMRRLLWGHTALGVIIGAAPLLGLLGTVTGMIVSFKTLGIFGSGEPQLMAGGIAQALSTTLLGLSVAIPLLIGHRWLLSLSNDLLHELDILAIDMVADARRPS